MTDDVEIDVYEPLTPGEKIDCYLGIDIGSTSTKATLMNRDKAILVGLYARTGGQPIAAVQRLTRAIAGLEQRFSVDFKIIAAGTTGSGRKFIQKVVRADYAVDEITAHARAAYHLGPGNGHDHRDRGAGCKIHRAQGRQRNFFRHELCVRRGHGKLYRRTGQETRGPPAGLCGAGHRGSGPFDQRQVYRVYGEGFESPPQPAIHARGVARRGPAFRQGQLSLQGGPRQQNRQSNHLPGSHGEELCPGEGIRTKATKTDHRLEILSSHRCIGVCLKMADIELAWESRFRRDLHTEQVVVDEYVCEYCKNHCKIKSVDLDGQTLGWGYLCGRDEHDSAYREERGSWV